MTHRHRNISVVDDEPPIRKALGRLFRGVGFEVSLFESGQDFLSSLQRQQPDCVVLDVHLPQLSGLEVQERLLAEHARLPVIVITGRDDPGLRQRVLDSGAVAYLTKPVEEEALLTAVAEAVGRGEQSQEVEDPSFDL
jgi:FixJ family two-component response regulator